MEIFFSLNFFNFLYIKNSLLLLFFLSVITYFVSQKEVSLKHLERIFFYNLYTIVFLVIASVFFNIFFAFDKKNSLIFTLLIFTLSFLIFIKRKGQKKLFEDLKYLKKDKLKIFKKIFLFLIIYIFLVILVNLSLFKTNVPYSWGINVDLYAHTLFINQLQYQKYFDWCFLNGHFNCTLKDLILLYPRGSHSFLAYLDLILPATFINKTDYGFIIFSIFIFAIFAYLIDKKINFIFILPFLLLPSFSIMLYRDHVNSSFFQIPLFLIYFNILERIKNNKPINFKNIMLFFLLFISGFLIYYFSLMFSFIPIFLFLNIFLISFLISKKKLTIFFIYFIVFVLFGVFLFLARNDLFSIVNSILSSALRQHIVDVSGFDLRINWLDFIGYKIFSYNYFDRYKENLFLQKSVLIFWTLILFTFIKNLFKKENLFLNIFILFNFLFFLVIENLTGGWNYLQIRYYSYLSVLLISYFLIDTDFLRTNRYLKFTILIFSFLSSIWFYKLYLENQVYVRTRVANSYAVDYKLPAFVSKEASDKKNVFVMHKQDFNRIFVLFFPNFYKNIYSYDRWDGRLINDEIIFKNKLNYEKKNISQVNFKNIDYLVVPYNFSYPKKLFTIIEKSEVNDYKFLKKKFALENIEPIFETDKEYEIKEVKNKIDNKLYYITKIVYDQNCFEIYKDGENFLKFLTDLENKNIRKMKFEYLIILKSKNFYINDDSLIYSCE